MQVERIRLPDGAPAVGQTLAETGLRSHTGALALSISRGENEMPTPDPRTTLEADDVLVIVGQPQQIAAARALLVGPGEAAARGGAGPA